MTAPIILIACAIILLLTLLFTHAKAYLKGVDQGRTEMIMFIREVSPEADEVLMRDLKEKNYLPGGSVE